MTEIQHSWSPALSRVRTVCLDVDFAGFLRTLKLGCRQGLLGLI